MKIKVAKNKFMQSTDDIYSNIKDVDLELFYELFQNLKYNYSISLFRKNPSDYVKCLIFEKIIAKIDE